MNSRTSNWKPFIGLLSAGVILAAVVILVGALTFFPLNRVTTPAASADQLNPPPAQPVVAYQAAEALPRTITVVGEGVVSIEPDVAVANIGVDIIGDTIREASDEASATMQEVMEALEAQGIAKKDIQTTGYNTWIERPYGGPGTLPTASEAIYHVNNTVMVVIRDLDTVGDILNEAIEAGANNIFGVQFKIDDPGELVSEARELAVQNAEARAEELATLNGAELGELVTLSEIIGSGGGFFPNSLNQFSAAYGMGGGGGGPVAPGELEIQVQLQVTYTLE